ncbi:MAG: [FeFe] hydrogenase H-cluster radical SAM maturase HydE [Chitinispirillaceae bacterium]|nr:[FeFe] hydrogenase H-cluster radical SAM maturase HydE [Chitinispirillaceae bacterium]
MNRRELLSLLRSTDPAVVSELTEEAGRVRDQSVGKAVYLRGLVEFSSYCRRGCTYCGINCANSRITRYRMTDAEILGCAEAIQSYAIGTVVLQSGEDSFFTGPKMATIISAIKERTGIAITLSLGERPAADLKLWREAGADRYLLRFETSDQKLFSKIHPPATIPLPGRIEQLQLLRELGYEVGSGIMTGFPGQTCASATDDLLLFQSLDLDMIGIGPYVPHPGTPMADEIGDITSDDQLPNTLATAYKIVALTRILCPSINMPCTTALRTIDPAGYREGLKAGCNVIMPNVTPLDYSERYDIYPGKKRVAQFEQALDLVEKDVTDAGCFVASGAGASRHYRERSGR